MSLTNHKTDRPEAILFGGCNGAGKTSLAFKMLAHGLQVYEFVNSDEIARGLNPLNQTSQITLASRLTIQRVKLLIEKRLSFAFEGTLAGGWQAKILQQCIVQGYNTRLIYIWLPELSIAYQRVKNRVEQGGHDVPASLIERRYNKSLINLCKLYLPVVENALILDGYDLNIKSSHVIAQKKSGALEIIQPEKWRLLC